MGKKTEITSRLPVKVIQPGEVKAKMREAKLEAIEFVNFLKHPEQYQKLGARLPRGVLFHGPPGTGKTLIAKAVAGEAKIPFLACAAASLLIGERGPEKLRQIFQVAREHSPCVLYFDEMDCIGRNRTNRYETPNPQLLGLCEELLVQLDGFETSGDDRPVLVFGSTNNFGSIDPALMRPGRFDRVIHMGNPNSEARTAIFEVHLSPLVTSLDKESLKCKLALRTPDFSGAQVAAVCNEAAMIAAREEQDDISLHHFDQAIDRLSSGLRDKRPQSPEVKRVRAHHEAAHIICGWFLEGAMPPTRATVVPSSKDKCSQPSIERLESHSKKQIMNSIACLVAGRVGEAETLDKDVICSGPNSMSTDDLETATSLAFSLMVSYGLGESMGKITTPDSFKDYACDKRPVISDDKNKEILKELGQILEEAEKIAKKVLEKHKEDFKRVVAALEERDSLNFDDLEGLLGPSPMPLADITAGMDALPSSLDNWDD